MKLEWAGDVTQSIKCLPGIQEALHIQSTQEVEKESGVQGHPELYSEFSKGKTGMRSCVKIKHKFCETRDSEREKVPCLRFLSVAA